LRRFIAAAEQNDHVIPFEAKIDPKTRPKMHF